MKERQSSRRRDDSSGSSLSGKSSRRKFEEGLPISNKKQILGFFLILFSILVAISIVSYSFSDESRLESINIGEIFKKENQSANYNTSNWLGIIGVIISGFFVKGTFGYFSLIMPLLLILFGLNMMRKKGLMLLMQFSVYSILLMIFLSALFGVFRTSLGVDKIPYSLVGTSGEYFASISLALLGMLGSYILLFGLVMVFAFLLLDRDIAKSLARIKFLFESIRDKYRTSMEEMRQKREEEEIRESKRLAIQKEREKILKTKAGGVGSEIEEPLLKDTKINRPVENEMLAGTKLTVKFSNSLGLYTPQKEFIQRI